MLNTFMGNTIKLEKFYFGLCWYSIAFLVIRIKQLFQGPYNILFIQWFRNIENPYLQFLWISVRNSKFNRNIAVNNSYNVLFQSLRLANLIQVIIVSIVG